MFNKKSNKVTPSYHLVFNDFFKRLMFLVAEQGIISYFSKFKVVKKLFNLSDIFKK